MTTKLRQIHFDFTPDPAGAHDARHQQ